MNELVVLPLAEVDLEGVWLDTLERWGSTQADIYVDQLYERLQVLRKHPELGKACDDLRAGYRRLLVAHHVAFYRIASDTIEIVRVLHERMDFDSHL